MGKDYIADENGRNLKFYRETLLNYAMNRWGLNKASSVGATSELIRNCSPESYEQWVEYYFSNAFQKKKDGEKITQSYLVDLGRKLYVKLSEVVQNELESITEEECIDYVYNLVINRTYEGYRTEIDTIYGQLQKQLGVAIKPAPDEWDRKYAVDFYIEINGNYIGLQIKPVSTGEAINNYQWNEMNKLNHEKFEKDYKGKVYYIYSAKVGGKKTIVNKEDVQAIKNDIEYLLIRS